MHTEVTSIEVSEAPRDDVETSATEADDQHLEPIILSNGKPLKGILKHRHHSGAQTSIHTKQIVDLLEGKISELDEVESSSEKAAASTNGTVDNVDSVTPPQNG